MESTRDLGYYKGLPLDIKVAMTKRRIGEFYTHFGGQVYLSWSGGKDSTVLKHIIQSMDFYGETIPFVFVDTGLEYPSVRQLVYKAKNRGENVVILRPERSFKQVIEEYGYPVISKSVANFVEDGRKGKTWALNNAKGLDRNGQPIPDYMWLSKSFQKYAYLIDAPFKVSEACCDVMKKKPFKKYEKETGYHKYVATLAEESTRRLESWKKYGCNAFGLKEPRSRPLSFWTENDILQYIVENNVEIAKDYGEIYYNSAKKKYETTGLSRTGCMFCAFGVHLEAEPNRFQQMKTTYPQLWDYCINKLNLKQVLDYINVPYDIDYEQIELGECDAELPITQKGV